MGGKMKFLYSKFTKAFSEVILTVLIVILIFGVAAIGEIISSDEIIDGEYEFKNTAVANRIANQYYDNLSNEMYRILRNMKEDENEENETVRNFDDDIPDYDNTSDESDLINGTVVYFYGYYEEYYGLNKITIDDFKNEEFIKMVLNEMERENVNYHFVVKIEDEILFTDIKDMSTVEYINDHLVGEVFNDGDYTNIYIENYINKNLEKGDDFFKYNYFYDKVVKNFWNIVIFLVISALLVIILAVYVVVTAGYKEDGTLGTGWMDNIPIEFYAILLSITTAFFVEGISISFLPYMQYILAAVILCFWVWLFISIIKTSISRLKNRVFLRKSIIGFVILFIVKLFKQVFVDVNTKLKAILAIGLVMFCEAVLVFTVMVSGGASMFMWLLIKTAQFALLLYIYSMVLKLRNAAKTMHDGGTDVKIDTRDMYGVIKETADYMNEIFIGLDKAVAEKLKSEQLKTELITNVSHDIKTPLTSIINYVDLMKKEDIDNPKITEYLDIVDKQSLRLKKLTEDVIEASKAATGNISADLANINVSEMIAQALGEYESKFNAINIMTVYENGDAAHYALADGRLLWRVIDNLFSNVCKYTLEGTRLYINIVEDTENVIVTIKNISKYQLNISSEELMQRFVRGDSSRSTSGNGLGLSIAESLTKLQGGTLKLDINGDLFIVSIYLTKNMVEETEQENTTDDGGSDVCSEKTKEEQ